LELLKEQVIELRDGLQTLPSRSYEASFVDNGSTVTKKTTIKIPVETKKPAPSSPEEPKDAVKATSAIAEKAKAAPSTPKAKESQASEADDKADVKATVKVDPPKVDPPKVDPPRVEPKAEVKTESKVEPPKSTETKEEPKAKAVPVKDVPKVKPAAEIPTFKKTKPTTAGTSDDMKGVPLISIPTTDKVDVDVKEDIAKAQKAVFSSFLKAGLKEDKGEVEEKPAAVAKDPTPKAAVKNEEPMDIPFISEVCVFTGIHRCITVTHAH
jgi:hypothetical protein